jgi:dTDP-4-amino-4,6-dideoxygalactose transaminase
MLPIQMVDLQTQYTRLKTDIDTAIGNVLQSGAFIKGPEVKSFERDLAQFTGAKHAIGCANGTDALQIAFMALQAAPGSEVITPSFSYAALAEVLHLLGLKPIFCEVHEDSYLMDASKIESLITDKTIAIAPVHLYGQCCDMEAILAIGQKHKLYVIEDTAQAIGAVYTFSDGTRKQAGTMGHIGTTSFFPSKNLGCYGDGGAVFCNDDALAERMGMVANHGQKVKYLHEIVGINSRLDTIQAAILQVKLPHLRDFEARRNHCADVYDAELGKIPGIQVPKRVANSTHVFHQYTIKLQSHEQREALKAYLGEKKVPCMIYYPTPLHQQQAYAQNLHMELTENLCKQVLSLPIHTEMEEEQLQYICSTIQEFFKA